MLEGAQTNQFKVREGVLQRIIEACSKIDELFNLITRKPTSEEHVVREAGPNREGKQILSIQHVPLRTSKIGML